MGANSDEVEVEFPGVNSELEEEDMEMTEMDPEENFEIPGVYMEGQESPPQVIKIGDHDIPRDLSIFAPKNYWISLRIQKDPHTFQHLP